jgi:hypothetical protein
VNGFLVEPFLVGVEAAIVSAPNKEDGFHSLLFVMIGQAGEVLEVD